MCFGHAFSAETAFAEIIGQRNFSHVTFSDCMLNETLIWRILSRFNGLNGFGKAFWLDYNLVFWVSQATTTTIHRTDPNGVATERDHANTCAHTGTKLPAYQTEPLQQSNHNTLWLSQVRYPTTGMCNSATCFKWHIHVFVIQCKDLWPDLSNSLLISFLNRLTCISDGEILLSGIVFDNGWV